MSKDDTLMLKWIAAGSILLILLLCGILASDYEGGSTTSSTARQNDFCTPATITAGKKAMETVSSLSRAEIPGDGYGYPMRIEWTLAWNAMWNSMTVAEKENLTIMLAAYKNCVHAKIKRDAPHIELRDLYTNEKFASISPWGGFKVFN